MKKKCVLDKSEHTYKRSDTQIKVNNQKVLSDVPERDNSVRRKVKVFEESQKLLMEKSTDKIAKIEVHGKFSKKTCPKSTLDKGEGDSSFSTLMFEEK